MKSKLFGGGKEKFILLLGLLLIVFFFLMQFAKEIDLVLPEADIVERVINETP